MAAVLGTVGQLSQVAGRSMQQHLSVIDGLLVDAVGDFADSVKRTVAVSTLGKV